MGVVRLRFDTTRPISFSTLRATRAFPRRHHEQIYLYRGGAGLGQSLEFGYEGGHELLHGSAWGIALKYW